MGLQRLKCKEPDRQPLYKIEHTSGIPQSDAFWDGRSNLGSGGWQGGPEWGTHAKSVIGARRVRRQGSINPMGNVVSFHRMPKSPEHRRGPDRRRRPRGGRREDDRDGFAPLVLLVSDDAGVADQSEAVLAKLRFGVTVSSSVEEALKVLAGLRPDIVVAGAADAHRIRMEAPEHLPVVVMTEEMRDDRSVLIEGIRQTLRSNKAI